MIFGWLDDHDALEADYQPECRARFDVAFLATGCRVAADGFVGCRPGKPQQRRCGWWWYSGG
jgi:hypothetical protein